MVEGFKTCPYDSTNFFAFFFVGLNKIRTFAKGNDDYGNKEYYLRDEVLR